MAEQPYKLPSVKGMNNRLPDFRHKRGDDSFVRNAVNVDVTSIGTLKRRKGTDRMVWGQDCHSLFADVRYAYFVDHVQLKRLDPIDFTTTVMDSPVVAGRRLSWAAVPGVGTMFSNALQNYLITDTDFDVAVPPLPSVNAVLSYTSGGSLPAGRYQVVYTLEDALGREGGSSQPAVIELPAGSNLVIANRPTSGRLYMTPANGDTFYEVAGQPPVAASGIITFLDPDAAGDTLTIGNITITLVNGAPANENQATVQSSAAATRFAVFLALTNHSDYATEAWTVEGINVVDLLVTASTAGPSGNSIPLAETGSSFTITGPFLTGGIATVISVTPNFGRRCAGLLLAPLPAGQILRTNNGRTFVASGSVLYYSEPYSLLYNPLRGYVQFPADITMMEPCGDGLYVAADQTYWFNGDIAKASMEIKLPYGAIFGAASTTENTTDVWWMSTKGVVIGTEKGQVKNVQEADVAVKPGQAGAALFRDQDGMRQMIASVFGTRNTVAAASTWMDAEVTRRETVL